MFYSHEVLTDRRYGVATIWLVATLGSKSTLKRVTRKAILDVNVRKACETIERPAAPMALRLQSNLLYGVARVYSQQCGYILSDAELAKQQMMTLTKVMRSSGLEAEGATKGRSDQLVLQDDPIFLPDFSLLPLDLDQLSRDPGAILNEESQGTLLSPHSSQRPRSSQLVLPAIDIPGASSSLIGGTVGGFRGSFSVRGNSDAAMHQDDLFLDDDLGLDIAPASDMRFSDGPSRQPPAPSARSDRTSGVGGAVRDRESAAEVEGEGAPRQVVDGGYVPFQQDDLTTQQAGYHSSVHDQQALAQRHTTSETAEAPARRRKKPAPKILEADATMELRNGDLARWNDNYVANMREITRHKNASKAAAIAKANARLCVLGATSSLQTLSQSDRLVNGPLGMFSGAKLLEALTGVDLVTGTLKRGREPIDIDDDHSSKRSCGAQSSPELGRGALQRDDDGNVLMGDGEYTGIEQGREAPTPLDDRHLSSIFPWNQSTGSRRPTGLYNSTSVAGPVGVQQSILGRRGSRLQSGSPLMGRGPGMTGLDDALDVDDPQQLGLYSDMSAAAGFGMAELDDGFEMFGPAAKGDTQLASPSQWQRAALDGEGINFLAFVQAAIAEADSARDEATAGDEEDGAVKGSIDFETLLSPTNTSRIVAAQGLLHVLSLGTKNLLKLDQDVSFGAITLRDISV